MDIARVVGHVVATIKHSKFQGCKLLRVAPEDPFGQPLPGPNTIAIDLVDAGEGDRVLVCHEGISAIAALGRGKAPVEAVIVAVVDSVRFAPGWEPKSS